MSQGIEFEFQLQASNSWIGNSATFAVALVLERTSRLVRFWNTEGPDMSSSRR